MKNTNIVIFGTGLFYLRRKHILSGRTKIKAFIDNDKKVQGKNIEGVLVYSPNDILKLEYDIIVLASINAIDMKNQLLSLGVPEANIMFWEQYVSSISHGDIQKYGFENIDEHKKKVLVIVPIINYAGGFLAVFYAAIEFQKKGYHVVIATPIADYKMVTEVNGFGICVWICPSLPYIEDEELEWISKFDYVFVNSLQNMLCANRISEKKPIWWWLHEHSKQYKGIVEQYGKDIDGALFESVNIFAVSELARKNFLTYYPNQQVEILHFGLPDFYRKTNRPHEKIIFAVIGNISNLKNQKELINAISKLPIVEKNQIECWIIGRDGERKYKEEVVELVKNMQQIKICGELTRKEIEGAFEEIDIVACTSREETMSITIIEGMMNHKICITNTNTGIAEFIQNCENGFVYEEGNARDLSAKLKYVIQNFTSLDFMRINARKTYEKYFSMKIFGDRLYDILEEGNPSR